MSGTGHGGLSNDLLDDILWNIENGPPARGCRTSPSPPPEEEQQAPWFRGHGPDVAPDEVVLVSSDGWRLTAQLDLFQQHSDVPQADGARAALPLIQLEATAETIKLLLLVVGGDVLSQYRYPMVKDAHMRFMDAPPLPAGPGAEATLSFVDSVKLFRLADYLDCGDITTNLIRIWNQLEAAGLVRLLEAASTLNDVVTAKVILASSKELFGYTNRIGHQISYAADNWTGVVGNLRAEWQVALFLAFWTPKSQLVERLSDLDYKRSSGRLIPRAREIVWVNGRRTPQEIADLFEPVSGWTPTWW